MKIIQIGVGAVICIALNACSGLFPDRKVGECYPVNTLNERQRLALNVGSGNPLLLIGKEKIVCSCYQGSLSGIVEQDNLVGAGEKDSLVGAGESGSLIGSGEKDSLVGAGESGSLIGSGEEESLVGAGENDSLIGSGEEGSLVGAWEKESLAGDFAEFSCRIVPECSGFQLIGYYGSDPIEIRTGTQQKSVSTDCITW